MLVCAFFAQNCTRDRGCSAHPVFPAPSTFSGGTKFMQASGASCRENAKSYSVVFAREDEMEGLNENGIRTNCVISFSPLSASANDTPAPTRHSGAARPLEACPPHGAECSG